MRPKKAFLLCAGRATRFVPHTLFLPKPLIPFLNVPIVAYNLYLLKLLGVLQGWAVNVHVHKAVLKKELNRLANTVGLVAPTFSVEDTLLGSAGGLLKLKDFFTQQKDSFFYLNGDSFIIPPSVESLLEFVQKHEQSQALASFLVCPKLFAHKGVIWANNQGVICSFSTRPSGVGHTKPYSFSGLAIIDPNVFKKIKPPVFHIFKDVFEKSCFKGSLRVHSVPDLQLLNMNQKISYLEGTKKALTFLKQNRGKGFLQNVLDVYTPYWRQFEGEHYFSASPLPRALMSGEDTLLCDTLLCDTLFCGLGVKGLNNILVKGFAVLGDGVVIPSITGIQPSKTLVSIESSVINKGVLLNNSLKHTLKL